MNIELQPTNFNLIAGALGTFLCLYGSLSYLVKERLYLNEAPLAVLAGIGLERLAQLLRSTVDPNSDAGLRDDLDSIGNNLSRLVLGIQLVLVGIQLPHKYLRNEIQSLSILLTLVMGTTWLITAGLLMAIIPNLSLLPALIIASCATPTDPVLSNALVKGSFADKHVSPWLRNLILAESGANDGFGYPFLFLALNLLKSKSVGKGLLSWFVDTCIYQVGLGAVFGIIVGVAANRILRFSTRHDYIDKEGFLCYGIAVGIFTTGIGGYLDLDDLFSAFVAGNALTWDDWYRRETEDEELYNVTDLLLNSTFFLFLGATIPWSSFTDMAAEGVTIWRLIILGISILLLRRLPSLVTFHRLIPRLRGSFGDAVFMGYFGPIGAGAIFYMTLVIEQLQDQKENESVKRVLTLITPITYALIISSLIGHSSLIPLVGIYLDKRIAKQSIKLQGEEESSRHETNDVIAHDTLESEAQPESSTDHSVSRPQMGERPRNLSRRRSRRSSQASSQEGAFDYQRHWKDYASWRHSTSHAPYDESDHPSDFRNSRRHVRPEEEPDSY
jgi:sodium/hydrogen antiporter